MNWPRVCATRSGKLKHEKLQAVMPDARLSQFSGSGQRLMDPEIPSASSSQPDRSRAETRNPICPACGIDLMMFRTTGRLGCPIDYEIFAEAISQFFDTNQPASVHTGKIPGKIPGRFDILLARAEMKTAIQNSDYERAAELRDLIRARQNRRKKTHDH